MPYRFSGRQAALALELGVEAGRLGMRAWAVGGCVRDWLSGRRTNDLDIVSESDCAPLAGYCARRHGARAEAFGGFGTVRCFLPDGSRVDFARARAEIYEAPAALPKVRPASIEDDLARRDFTVNAMAVSLMPGDGWCLLDLFGGKDDLSRGSLRVLHVKSFIDDPTRLYRACRFAARFAWRFERGTERLLRRAASSRTPGLLSRARLRQELMKILEEGKPAAAFKLMTEYGLADFIYPGLCWSPAAGRLKTPEGRLGALAVSFAGEGEKFLASLELPRGLCAELRVAAKLAAEKRAPERPLTELQKAVLRACDPDSGAAALRPVMVDGAMLKSAGLSPGKKFSELIAAAARAQYRGAYSSSAGARKWLREQLAASGREGGA